MVPPATSEDLYEKYGLDALMPEVFRAIEPFSGWGMSESRIALASRTVCRRRQALIWSLLAWEKGHRYARGLLGTLVRLFASSDLKGHRYARGLLERGPGREQAELQRLKNPTVIEAEMVL